MSMNPAFVIAATGGAVCVLGHYISKQQKKKELEPYRDRREHIVIISKHPDKPNQWFNVPPDTFGKYCHFVNEEDLQREIRKHQNLLRESGNDFFENGQLKEEHQLKILYYVFQDGEFAGEDWKGYEDRVLKDVQKHRIPFHKALKAASAADYYEHSKGVDYSNPSSFLQELVGFVRAVSGLF